MRRAILTINLNRMTELQKEYCEEKGIQFINVWITKEIVDYADWLEEKLQALRIHDVVGRSEQLCVKCNREKQLQKLTDQAQELNLGYED